MKIASCMQHKKTYNELNLSTCRGFQVLYPAIHNEFPGRCHNVSLPNQQKHNHFKTDITQLQ